MTRYIIYYFDFRILIFSSQLFNVPHLLDFFGNLCTIIKEKPVPLPDGTVEDVVQVESDELLSVVVCHSDVLPVWLIRNKKVGGDVKM